MKKTLLVMLCLNVAAICVEAQSSPVPVPVEPEVGEDRSNLGPITVDELNKRGISNYLGLPLGTVTDIQAVVVAGSSLRLKGYQSD